jgi:hypothetical protein
LRSTATTHEECLAWQAEFSIEASVTGVIIVSQVEAIQSVPLPFLQRP